MEALELQICKREMVDEIKKSINCFSVHHLKKYDVQDNMERPSIPDTHSLHLNTMHAGLPTCILAFLLIAMHAAVEGRERRRK